MEEENNKRQYFVVGASYNNEPQADRFIRDGIWALGWNGDDAPSQYDPLLKMKSGDFIAIKRMNGRGQQDVTILARGIVRGVITEARDEKRFVCTVNWFETNVNKVVPAKHRGIFQSVVGPLVFEGDDKDWLTQVFGL